jgi:hypothetical protein
MNASARLAARTPQPRRSVGAVAGRFLLHCVLLLVAIACFAAYQHLKVEGRSTAALASLAAAAVFGFAPLRDLLRIVFRLEGKALHLAHALGSLALIAVPLSGRVSSAPVLTRTALAPFAVMGAAQAMMHADHPRSARQAAAMKRFVAGLPEVSRIAAAGNLTSPENAGRAVAALSDMVSRAQALGETELESDPGFQSALSRASTRFGASLGLDAVDLALDRLAQDPRAARAVPGLRARVAAARATVAGTASPTASAAAAHASRPAGSTSRRVQER